MSPSWPAPDGKWACDFAGIERVPKSKEEVEQAVEEIKNMGSYPFLTETKEAEEISANPDGLIPLFKTLMTKSIEEWMRLAEERLKGTNVKCFISPGNDDYFKIDKALDSSIRVINPEQKVVDIDGEHEMITLGYTNHTPRNSPREVDEAVLDKIRESKGFAELGQKTYPLLEPRPTLTRTLWLAQETKIMFEPKTRK